MGMRVPAGLCAGCLKKVEKARRKWCDACRPQDKYRSVKVGTSASKKEHGRLSRLRMREQFGHIRGLRTQVPFDLVVNGVKICRYVADAVYDEEVNGSWTSVVEDTKGLRTRMYRLKKKLMKALFGIEIREV